MGSKPLEVAGTDKGEALRGDLAEIPAYAVLQLLERGRKTGLLWLESSEGTGRMWLADGEPVHAVSEGQVGREAALSLVACSSGHFRFDAGTRPPERTLECGLTELLLEGGFGS